jgi:hypothetical protein
MELVDSKDMPLEIIPNTAFCKSLQIFKCPFKKVLVILGIIGLEKNKYC